MSLTEISYWSQWRIAIGDVRKWFHACRLIGLMKGALVRIAAVSSRHFEVCLHQDGHTTVSQRWLSFYPPTRPSWSSSKQELSKFKRSRAPNKAAKRASAEWTEEAAAEVRFPVALSVPSKGERSGWHCSFHGDHSPTYLAIRDLPHRIPI